MQSVGLLLDAFGDAALRTQWKALEDAHLPSQGQIRSGTNRPHITLGVAPVLPVEVEAELVTAIVGLPIPVRLGGLLVFGRGRYILARHVVLGPELTELQRRVAEVFASCVPLLPTMAPGQWTPHITLARRLGAAQVGRALDALRTAGKSGDLVTQAEAVRRWDGDARREWLLASRSGRGRPG